MLPPLELLSLSEKSAGRAAAGRAAAVRAATGRAAAGRAAVGEQLLVEGWATGRVSVSTTYTPPLGALPAVIDRALSVHLDAGGSAHAAALS